MRDDDKEARGAALESPSWMRTEEEKGLSKGVHGEGAAPTRTPKIGGLSPPGFQCRREKETCAQVLVSPEQGFGVLSGCQSL